MTYDFFRFCLLIIGKVFGVAGLGSGRVEDFIGDGFSFVGDASGFGVLMFCYF